MSGTRRCSQTGRWPGQHHRGADRGQARSRNSVLRTLAGLVLFSSFLNAASLLHIRILEGEGAIHAAGARSSRGLSVEITDETGRPVDGAAVSFRLPEDGPGGTYSHGMRTEILMTGPDGRASVHEFLAGRSVGPFQVRVTAVRDSIRAGTVVDQYISEAKTAAASPSGARVGKGSSKKWVVWGAIGAGAVAAGLIGGRSAGSSAAIVAPPVAAAPPPTVGVPVITIGRPQ